MDIKNSFFKNIYNKANHLDVSKNLDINDEIFCSYIDILKSKTLKKDILQPINCKCLDPVNRNLYYSDCKKCNKTGYIEYLNEKIIGNECKGKGYIVENKCNICNGEGYYLDKKSTELKLEVFFENNKVIKYEKMGIREKESIGDLYLKINIFDYNDYDFKGSDVYYKKVFYFSKKDKELTVETPQGFKSIKNIKNDQEYEIIKIEKHGILKDNIIGDFYVVTRKELEPIKGADAYKNVILDSNLDKNIFVLNKQIEDNNVKVLDFSRTIKSNIRDYKIIKLENIENKKI